LAETVVPSMLYHVDASIFGATPFGEADRLLRQFHAPAGQRIDVTWLLKGAGCSDIRSLAVDATELFDRPLENRGLYEHLTAIPNHLLAAYAGMTATSSPDPFIDAMADVRARVTTLLGRWRKTDPRVFIYGASLHTKLLLTMCPELGPMVAGFIDRQPAVE